MNRRSFLRAGLAALALATGHARARPERFDWERYHAVLQHVRSLQARGLGGHDVCVRDVLELCEMREQLELWPATVLP